MRRGCCSARRRRLPTRWRRRGHGSSLPHATDRDRSAPSHRGQGLSRRLLEALMSHADVQGLRRMLLVTRDAHGVYAKVDFTPLAAPDRFMERHRPNACRGPGAD
ncbi:MAG: GNAT family N-acetyltransferase [Gemmatimonas sp.]|nr:GNAT family N-acetyltransferase [Gemmatimonas sp.]MCA2996799.1 GNAT family N-acetyltransferase [Gemmatimonas sp.]